MRGIELRSRDHCGRVDECRLVIRLIVADEVRPAVVAGAAGLPDLIVAARAASDRIHIGVGTHVAPVEEPGMRVDRDPIRVTMPHRVYLRSRLRCSLWKKISVGDRVSTVRL